MPIFHCVVTEKVPARYTVLSRWRTRLLVSVQFSSSEAASLGRGNVWVCTWAEKVCRNVSEYWYSRGKAWKGCMRRWKVLCKEKCTMNCLVTGWERYWYVKEKVPANKERYLQNDNAVHAMCDRLGDSIVAHNVSCIDPWYGPREIRTIEFLNHTVASKSTEPFCLLFMMTSSNGNIFRVTGPLCR